MKILVSTWKNSQQNILTGAGYGIRISKFDFNKIKNWKQIRFDKVNSVLHRGRKRFTIECPEIRSVLIGRFLIMNKLNKWRFRKPFTLSLTLINSKFGIWKLKLE